MATIQRPDLSVIKEDIAESSIALEEWKEKQRHMKRFLKDARRASKIYTSTRRLSKSMEDKTDDKLNVERELLRLGFSQDRVLEIVENLAPDATLEDWVIENLRPQEEPEAPQEEEAAQEEEEEVEEEPPQISLADIIECL